MNTFVKNARRIALAITLVGTLSGSGVVAHAEGGGVGSGGYPPPRVVCQTADYTLYDNGTRIYRDGTIVYADGTVSHL